MSIAERSTPCTGLVPGPGGPLDPPPRPAMSDEDENLPTRICQARRVTRREALGTFAAGLAVGPVAATAPPAAFRLATFSADVTPPQGHPLMGGGIPPARDV